MSPVKSFGKRSFDRSHVVTGIFSARCLFSKCQISKQLTEQNSPAKQKQKDPTVLGEIKISHAHTINYYLIPHRLLNVFAISAEEPFTTNRGSVCVCLFVCLVGCCHGNTDTYWWKKTKVVSVERAGVRNVKHAPELQPFDSFSVSCSFLLILVTANCCFCCFSKTLQAGSIFIWQRWI